jgi:anaerobic selenocysteine-containing dehydrogenase
MSVIIGNQLYSSACGAVLMREVVRLQLLLGNIGLRGGGIYTGYRDAMPGGVAMSQFLRLTCCPGNVPYRDEETALWSIT